MSEKKNTAVNNTAKPVVNGRQSAKSEKTVLKNKAAGVKTDGFCVYIGPTIMGVIQAGTIYRGEKAAVLTAIAPAIEKHPLIASLIVAGDTLSVDRIKVKTPGNLLYINYNKLMRGKK